MGPVKQLPGRSRPKWLVAAGQLVAAVVFVAVTISILPMLLMTVLVTAVILLLTLRQLRREADRAGIDLNGRPARERMIDVTPLHGKVQRDFWQFLGRRR